MLYATILQCRESCTGNDRNWSDYDSVVLFVYTMAFLSAGIPGIPGNPGSPGNPGTHGISGKNGQKGDKGTINTGIIRNYFVNSVVSIDIYILS